MVVHDLGAALAGRSVPGLSDGSPFIEAGARLPNVNEDFSGGAPDIGMVEFGDEMPHYGPG